METNNASDGKHEGWLMKQGKILKNWKKFWFKLENGQLSFANDPSVKIIFVGLSN